MREFAPRRPKGATVLAIVIGWLGVAGILNAFIWPAVLKLGPAQAKNLFPAEYGSPVFSLLALAYGASGLAAARAVWQLSASASRLYLLWCGCVLLTMMFLISIEYPRSPTQLPTGVKVMLIALTATILGASWLFVRWLVSRWSRVR